MPIPTLRRRRGLVPGRGISSLADVPADPHSKALHLCRYPEKCCTVCDRHHQRCRASRRPPGLVIHARPSENSGLNRGRIDPTSTPRGETTGAPR